MKRKFLVYWRQGKDDNGDAQMIALRRRFDAYSKRYYQWRGTYGDCQYAAALPLFNRPAGRFLLRDMARGDVLAVTEATRIVRSMSDWKRLLRVARGFKLTLDIGGVVIRPHWRVPAHVPGLDRLRNVRQQDGAACRRESLRYAGRLPFGWAVNCHGRLIPNLSERASIEAISRRKADEHLTFDRLFFTLEREKVRARYGKLWTRSGLHRALTARQKGWPMPSGLEVFRHNASFVRDAAAPPVRSRNAGGSSRRTSVLVTS